MTLFLQILLIQNIYDQNSWAVFQIIKYTILGP